MFRHLSLFSLSFLAALTATSCAAPSPAAPLISAHPSRLAFDFNDGPTWKAVAAYASAKTIKTAVSYGNVGSYNVAGSDQQSGGWLFKADETSAPKNGVAGFVSGPLAVKTKETNLGKLTLAFTLSASANRPVKVKIASYNAAGKRSGGLETTIYPAAPDFLQRYALDLNTFKPSGAGKFSPSDPTVQFAFEIGADWPTGNNELRVDDVSYSGAAFYVSPNGKDTNDGKTEKTPFATPQKALDEAQAGDIVLLMEGTYDAGGSTVANFPRAGAPAAWIVLKNYPGAQPKLTCTGWNMVFIGRGNKTTPDTETTLGYLEIRGLHLRGEGDVAKAKYPEAMNQADPRTNTNGIAIDGRYMKNVPHHIRIADNLVEYCPGGGMGPNEADWVTMENNIARYNCWTTIYATSGIGTLGASNFDSASGIYKMLIRNNVVYRNQTYEIWKEIKKPSDGNGIIIDVNQKTGPRPDGAYIGRTLVQNNLCYDNGGSGIHTVRAFHVDIINNTTYLNSANKDLQYSQIFGYSSEDVRVLNNILVAPVANLAAGEKPEPVNKNGGYGNKITYANNLYFGGNIAPDLGEGDKIGDPMFVNGSVDPKVADFRLKPGSPALGAGQMQPFGPSLNLDGKPRGNKPSLGAFQK